MSDWKERLHQLRPIIVRVVAYPLVFGFFFVTFVYWTFPYERLAEVIEANVEAPRVSRTTGLSTPSGIELSIGHLGPTFLPGLQAEDVRVTFLPQPSTPGGTIPAGARSTVMELEKVRVRVSILPLLIGHLNTSFTLTGLNGEAEGSASVLLNPPPATLTTAPPAVAAAAARRAAPPPALTELALELRDLNVAQLGPLVQAVGLPLNGRLTGSVELTVPNGNVALATGTVAMTIDRLMVGDGRAQFPLPGMTTGVTIEQIRAGRLELNIAAQNGVLTFERTASHSPEFDLAIDGTITLRPNFQDSVIGMGIRFRLTDVYRNKSQQAGNIMGVMEMVPELRRARRSDGMMGFRCSGTIARGPRCLPAGGNAPAAGAGAAGGGASPFPAGMGP